MDEVFKDLSQWHHLIFCEELVTNDGENDVFCWLCEKSVLGCPAYKCLECNFLQHESCPESQYEEMDECQELGRHHLIFVEEVDNCGKEEVVCPRCQEPAFGPAYKCSFYPKYCTFFLHKSCSELSHLIQHPMHPEHTLFLRAPSGNRCDVCHNDCRRSIFYRCSPCDFDIDIKCVSRWGIGAEDCHQHALFPMRKQMQFTCEACAKESNDIAYQCNVCRVLIHGKCAHFRHTIKIRTHHHFLTRTYFLCQDEQQDNVFCELCRQKVNTEYAAYYCRKCRYIAHLYCANYLKDEYEGQSATTDEVDATQLVHLVEGINLANDERAGPQEIEHFSHLQHNLFLTNEKLMNDMRCEACMQFIIYVPFYGCVECKLIFLHYRCSKLPAKIKRGLFHEHPLTLISQYSDEASGLFKCDACGCYRHGFTYECDKCSWYNLDVQCCLIPKILEHEEHQHPLHITIFSTETCNGCGQEGVYFRCTDCNNFTLCFRCATLPFVARYEYDTHLLKLSSTREDDFGEYYCLICEKERDYPDHWFYYCVKCKFTAHTQCVLGENPCINYGRTFTDKDHEHPLTIIQKTKHSSPCDACGESFIDMAFECTQCKFKVHPERTPYHWYDCLQEISKKRVE